MLRTFARWLGAAVLCALAASGTAPGGEANSDIVALKQQMDAMQQQMAEVLQTNREKQTRIETLEQQVKVLQQAPQAAKIDNALDRALSRLDLSDAPNAKSSGLALSYSAAPAGGPKGNIRLADISVNVLTAAGGSTATDEQLENLQGGAHDPKKRGFTLQQTELSFYGAVDPYFNLENHTIIGHDPTTGETEVEIEEAFLTTTSLPFNLQVKAGQYFTEFGRINPVHPHAWDWMDQPVVISRLFGGDGLRNPGARLSWLTPAPWYSKVYLGVQNASGETAASFIAPDEVGGRPHLDRFTRNIGDMLVSARWENSLNLTESLTTLWGFSALHGPNNTGPNGETWIGGLDFQMTWRPADSHRTGHFVKWQTEVLGRGYQADRFANDFGEIPADTLHDWGLYTQVEAGFAKRWAAGVRFDYAQGSGRDFVVGEDEIVRASPRANPFRDARWRVSPLVECRLSEFSRVRFQYNFDHAEHLSRATAQDGPFAHSLWVGFEVFIGAHAAHKY
jgi:hypothetical protein